MRECASVGILAVVIMGSFFMSFTLAEIADINAKYGILPSFHDHNNSKFDIYFVLQ